MVSFINVGRCGNFLFECATAWAYAQKHGLDFTVPSTTTDLVSHPIYLQHLVNPNWNPALPTMTVQETRHSWQEIPFQEEWRSGNILLSGYWQSEKYFKDCREEILKTFAFPWNPVRGVVSVHVRRGDYLRLPEKHPPVPVEWIKAAMDQFPGYRFEFFSDEIHWCRRMFRSDKRCAFSQRGNEVADLIGMSECEHHICSASTFSWWGAWLNRNPNKRVVIPKLWFMPAQKEETHDIVPDSWTKL